MEPVSRVFSGNWGQRGIPWNSGAPEMRFWVGVTDYDWFTLHASKAHVEKVNFWKPSEKGSFKAFRVLITDAYPVGQSAVEMRLLGCS